MKVHLKHLLLTSVIFLTIFNIRCQGLDSLTIEKTIQKPLIKQPYVGAAVGVVSDKKIVFSKGFGNLSLSSNSKVTDSTLFAIASLSKAFTATAILILEERNQVSLKDKVVKYIPEFKMYDEYITNIITIEDLLSHRSGLPSYAGDLLLLPDNSSFKMDNLLNVYEHFEPEEDFRTTFNYNNILYIIAGEIISRVSGVSYADFIKDEILLPLGMHNTYMHYDLIPDTTKLATPHFYRNKKFVETKHYTENSNLLSAAGGMYSNIVDLNKWIQFNLRSIQAGSILSRKNHFKLWETKTLIDISSPNKVAPQNHYVSYGLGWYIYDRDDYVHIYHTGSLDGMLSQIILIPALNFGTIILTNSSLNSIYSSVPYSVIDSMVISNQFQSIDRMIQRFDKTREKNIKMESLEVKYLNTKIELASNNQIELNTYLGYFNSPWMGDFKVSLKDEKLYFESELSPSLSGTLIPIGEDEFVIRWDNSPYPFDAIVKFEMTYGTAHKITLKKPNDIYADMPNFKQLILTRI